MDEQADNPSDVSPLMPGPTRSLVGAAALSFIQPGLGHVYAGQVRRGVVVYGLGYLFSLCAFASLIYIPLDHLGAVLAVLWVIAFRAGCIVDAVVTARRNRYGPLRGYQRWWVYLLILVVALPMPMVFAHPIRSYWMEMYSMPTGSMSDTLMPGDKFVIEKRRVFARPINRGDVLAYYSKGPGSAIFVKRVIGLSGDVIEINNEKLYRNYEPVDEPYLKFEDVAWITPQNTAFGPISVPAGKLFMVGDNRRISDDSRYSGSVPIEYVIGHVITIYWSRVSEALPHIEPVHLGIDADHPSGTIRWSRIGKRIIDSER